MAMMDDLNTTCIGGMYIKRITGWDEEKKWDSGVVPGTGTNEQHPPPPRTVFVLVSLSWRLAGHVHDD
jgi:hypothetical protein